MNLELLIGRLNGLAEQASQRGADPATLGVFFSFDGGMRVEEVRGLELDLSDNPEPGVYLFTDDEELD